MNKIKIFLGAILFGVITFGIYNINSVNAVDIVAQDPDTITINRQKFECGEQETIFTGTATYDLSSEYIRWTGVFLNGELIYSSSEEPSVWSSESINLVPGLYEVFGTLVDMDSEEGVAYDLWEFEIMECEPEPTPTPTPTPTPEPEPTPVPTEAPRPGLTQAGAPQCTDTRPVLLPANPLVWRMGGTARVQWQPTEGDHANVYYHENQNPDNAHAVRDTENDGYVEIGELGGLDWTFGIQQANGCAGGDTVWVVDGNTDVWVLFRP